MFPESAAPVPRLPKVVVGIDPGIKGALVCTNGLTIDLRNMPIYNHPVLGERVDCEKVTEILLIWKALHGENLMVVVERAKPMAMGSAYAFRYGIDFGSILHAVDRAGLRTTLVEPHVWTKAMHEGTSDELRPKARSEACLKKRYPEVVGQLPRGARNKKLLDGPMDAFLIAAWGLGSVAPTPAVAPASPARPCPFCRELTMVAGKCARLGCIPGQEIGSFY